MFTFLRLGSEAYPGAKTWKLFRSRA